MKYAKTLLERLEVWGTIVIMDKEEGDYMITTSPTNIDIVKRILEVEVGLKNFEIRYIWQTVKYEVDFNITKSPEFGIKKGVPN